MSVDGPGAPLPLPLWEENDVIWKIQHQRAGKIPESDLWGVYGS